MLFPHQKYALNKLLQPTCDGLIIYHKMGTGKTLIALKCLELIHGEKLVVSPASLVNRYNEEAKKHNIKFTNTQIISYEKGLRVPDLQHIKYSLIIFDEAHRLRNVKTETYKFYSKLIRLSKKKLFMSGTIEYNQPSDIGTLINLINPKEKFPETIKQFSKKYIDSKTNLLINKDELKEILNKYVDYYAPNDKNDFFPIVQNLNFFSVMSSKQEKIYKFLAKKLPWHLRNAVKRNIPLSLSESALINKYSSGIRQASLSITKFDKTATFFDSPKLVLAVKNMLNDIHLPYFKGLVYSNYIECGLLPYRELLKYFGINSLLFTGSLSLKQKISIINEFNSESSTKKILLISSSGVEGINLFGIRKIQILEPHFNIAKINQVISRGIRIGSHNHLQKSDRCISIEKYYSIFNKNFFNKIFGTKVNTSIDIYLEEASVRKQKIIDEIISLINKY